MKGNTDESNFMDELITFTAEEEGYKFNSSTCTSKMNDERLIWYNWLADSATTLHVTYQHEAFASYTPTSNSTVTEVGGKEAVIAGCGTVELSSMCNGQQFTLHLKDVLYVPGQRNNLISLGRWDEVGGR